MQTHTTNWIEILFIIGVALMFNSISHVFYNSLLMLVTAPDNIVKVACLQSGIGGFAAAVLLSCLGLADEENAMLERDFVTMCFVYAAIWFILLSIPMWIWLEEAKHDEADTSTVWDSLQISWIETLQSMKNTEMMKYLLAMILFSDASSTLHSVYLVYAAQVHFPRPTIPSKREQAVPSFCTLPPLCLTCVSRFAQIGIPTHVLLLGSVMNRWLAGITSLAWLGTSQYLSPKSIMVLSILLTAVSIVFCAWMENEVHFYIVVFFLSVLPPFPPAATPLSLHAAAICGVVSLHTAAIE